MDELRIEMLSDNLLYSMDEFDCGDTTLNTFLTAHLRRQHDGKILRGYVLRTVSPASKILGYYTLSGSSFEKATLPSRSQQKKVIYQNVPCVMLGRLAVDKSLQGAGWGSTLVAHAMNVVYHASHAVGIYGLFVEAINEKAKEFYISLGFIPLSGNNNNALFYPTQSIEQLFAKPGR
jgi:ribosomal protein S18 acetylase RimI-like enzyme